MIKEMQGWKVVTINGRSSTSSCLPVIYHVNVEVFPRLKGSKLFFFKSRKDAKLYNNSFLCNCNYGMIVPCIARNVTTPKWMCCAWDKNSLSHSEVKHFLSFWESKAKYRHPYKMPVIPGTMFAESIICLK